MGYKCRICGINEVDNQGDVCELCAIGQDPYAVNMSGSNKQIGQGYQTSIEFDNVSHNSNYTPKHSANRKVLLNGGTALSNTDPYGNDISESQGRQQPVQVYSAGKVPQTSQQNDTVVSPETTYAQNTASMPITSGITKNIVLDNPKRSILYKWFRALFTRIPFTLDDDVTMFQVFPDYSGTSLNSLGNACDQVIVYGRLNNGAISENNDVEIFGNRDTNNNIIAKTIRNKASGTTIVPMRTLNTGAVWLITVMVFALIIMAIMGLGVEGIIWTVVLILCFTNLPKVMKIVGILFGMIFSFLKRLF